MKAVILQPGDIALIRWVLALVWIATGLLSMGIFPVQESLGLLAAVGLHGAGALMALYGAAVLDIVLGVLTLSRPSVWLWRMQAVLIMGYSVIIAIALPSFWLHPFGPMLKNMPILLLLWLLHRFERRTV